MSATGRLTLYPRPDGWVKVGLSGLELVNFKGVARQERAGLQRARDELAGQTRATHAAGSRESVIARTR
jgi:hypothetical protein